MADKFPGPYVNTVPQDVDNPGPMIERVKFSTMDVGARKSILPKDVRNRMTIQHVSNQNSK